MGTSWPASSPTKERTPTAGSWSTPGFCPTVPCGCSPSSRRWKQYRAGSRIVIEEFDNGLHPSRAKLLVGALAETASRRKLNVLVTTHNPAFMDAFEESKMKSVLICHSEGPDCGSRVTRLDDMDIAGTVGLRGGLGDFVSRGVLERHLSPDFTKKRTKETREWLASLS